MPIPVLAVLQGIASTAPAAVELLKAIAPLLHGKEVPEEHEQLAEKAMDAVAERRNAIRVLTNVQ